MKPASRSALTLVELLVAIAIIAILVAILLPAVQAARESARRAVCQNHLKQMALGALTHYEQQGHLPTGGWVNNWTGDPDRGFSQRQPGGWAFNLLPFVEESQLHQLGSGQSDPAKVLANKEREVVPVSIYFCPSRRPPLVIGYDNWPKSLLEGYENNPFAPMDYVANKGRCHRANSDLGRWPNNWQQADAPEWRWPTIRCSGVVYRRSLTRLARSKGERPKRCCWVRDLFRRSITIRTGWMKQGQVVPATGGSTMAVLILATPSLMVTGKVHREIER